MNKVKSIHNYIVKNDLLLSIIMIGIIILALFILDIGCPTRYLTGICCPGCGMTRATIHLLQGDVKTAVYYHPLVFTLPMIAILFILRNKINTLFVNSLLILIILAFIIVYYIRLIDPYNEVVYADIRRGMIYKIICKFY